MKKVLMNKSNQNNPKKVAIKNQKPRFYFANGEYYVENGNRDQANTKKPEAH